MSARRDNVVPLRPGPVFGPELAAAVEEVDGYTEEALENVTQALLAADDLVCTAKHSELKPSEFDELLDRLREARQGLVALRREHLPPVVATARLTRSTP